MINETKGHRKNLKWQKNFERQNNRWEINTKGHSSKVINAGWEWEIKTNGNNVGSVGSYKKKSNGE